MLFQLWWAEDAYKGVVTELHYSPALLKRIREVYVRKEGFREDDYAQDQTTDNKPGGFEVGETRLIFKPYKSFIFR